MYSGILRFFLCELYTAARSRRGAQEGSQEATTSEPHRGTGRPCVVLGSFFQHTLQSPEMKTLQIPLIICSQCFSTLTVAKLFLLCNLDLTCCILSSSLCCLSLGEVKNSCFPSPYGSLCFVWGLLRHRLSSRLPLSRLIKYSSFEKLFNPSKSTSFCNACGCTQQKKKHIFF